MNSAINAATPELKKLTKAEVSKFQKHIWNFYQKHTRHFPWRETTDPYKIMVSELMLQQTQTYRVLPKYEAFIKKFPFYKHRLTDDNSRGASLYCTMPASGTGRFARRPNPHAWPRHD